MDIIEIKTQAKNYCKSKKSDNMNNKLFLVCPFSNMENFIRKKYGPNIFFMTSIAGIFQSKDENYVKAIRGILSLFQF